MIETEAKNNKYTSLNPVTIDKFSDDFLNKSKLNPFYGMTVFFTQKLRVSKYIEFQIIGNMGGSPEEHELNSTTNFYIIADTIVIALRNGIKDKQLKDLEDEINKKSNRYENLKILTEEAFLKHIKKRCDEIGDRATLHLVNQIPGIT